MKTHIDLFSGIGGFALAARWSGIRTVAFCEIDPFCQKVLRKNFGKDIFIHDDIKTFTNAESSGFNSIGGTLSEKWEWQPDCHNSFRPFLLTGGFPCQPFSCAGQRKGTGDDRHLWPHMLRVIQEFHPRWIIAENVGGIVNIKNMEQQDSKTDMEDETLDGGEDCGTTSVLISILNDLEAIGYSVQIFIIPACSLNAPHRRDRVWIVANSNRTGSGTPTSGTDRNRTEIGEEQQLPQSEYSRQDCHATDTRCKHGKSGGNDTMESCATKRSSCKSYPERCGENVTDTESKGRELRKSASNNRKKLQEGIFGCDNSDACNSCGKGLEGGIIKDRSNNTMPNRGENWEQNWFEVATRLCRVDDGLPTKLHRVNRLKSLGNAIVPQVAFELMKAIIEVDNELC